MNLTRSLGFASAGLLACAFASPHTDPTAGKKKVPTFATDVAPILYSKCATCHHQGEVAPFSLTSYADARAKAKTIAAAVQDKLMPPWQAVSHGEFVNERTLSKDQIATLCAWADAGAPAGALENAPKPPTFAAGWMMGTPDFVGQPASPYTISSEGTDDYRCFVIPTNFPEDRYVTGIEVRPENRKVVHHVLLYLDSNGVARKKQSNDGKPGYASFGGPGFAPTGSLGGWAPGIQPQILKPGCGFLLEKGADIVLQVHYHKDGKQETDLTKVGLKFSKIPIDKKVRWNALGNELIEIPPGDKQYTLTSSLTVPRAVTLLDVIPHMHLLGHDMKVTATFPDGSKKTLVDVNNYDFNWQTRYSYVDPVHLPVGTKLDMVAHYDNSTDNPHNPNNPPKKVTFGEQTTNEMCFAFFSYTIDTEHLAKGAKASDIDDFSRPDDELKQVFDRFDTNHDGYLDRTELAALLRFFESVPDDDAKRTTAIDKQANLAIMFYGKEQKGKVSRAEFAKMVKDSEKRGE